MTLTLGRYQLRLHTKPFRIGLWRRVPRQTKWGYWWGELWADVKKTLRKRGVTRWTN